MDTTHRPQDDNPEDRDKPVALPTAADHRPDQGADGGQRQPTKGLRGGPRARNQNPTAKMPHPSRLQKQQRSPNMNTEKNK